MSVWWSCDVKYPFQSDDGSQALKGIKSSLGRFMTVDNGMQIDWAVQVSIYSRVFSWYVYTVVPIFALASGSNMAPHVCWAPKAYVPAAFPVHEATSYLLKQDPGSPSKCSPQFPILLINWKYHSKMKFWFIVNNEYTWLQILTFTSGKKKKSNQTLLSIYQNHLLTFSILGVAWHQR